MKDSKQVYMILTNGFDPDVRVYKEAKYLVNEGFNVTILCWDRKCEFQEKTEEMIDNIKIKRFHILSQPGTGLRQIFPYFKFIKVARRYLKDKKYTYLHCHDFDGIIVGLFTKNKKEKKIIFDMHEIYNNYAYAKNIFFHKFFKYVLNKVNYIIYVNEEQIKEIERIDKLVFLPNYPQKEAYMPITKTQSKKIRVNYIGSLRDYNSLKSLAETSMQNENLEIGLYGTGICYEQLREEYKDSSVKIYGKYDGINESGEIYRNTDILYCSYNPNVENWRNAYPVKLYEAIITLTPIIVTENTVVGDFVNKNKVGAVVEYNNIDSIKKAILQVKNNYQTYVNNLRKISDKYKWEEIVKKMAIIYN